MTQPRSPTRWPDGSEIGLEPDWRLGISSMVSCGIEAVREGRAGGLRFSCFNRQETDYVDELMARHPEIWYRTTRITRE